MSVGDVHVSHVNLSSPTFFVSREGGWEFHPYIRAAFAMGKAVDRGRVLLQSPVVFQPVVQPHFPFRLCILSAISGFATGVVVFIAWIWTL